MVGALVTLTPSLGARRLLPELADKLTLADLEATVPVLLSDKNANPQSLPRQCLYSVCWQFAHHLQRYDLWFGTLQQLQVERTTCFSYLLLLL
jgi:hypothetical protein